VAEFAGHYFSRNALNRSITDSFVSDARVAGIINMTRMPPTSRGTFSRLKFRGKLAESFGKSDIVKVRRGILTLWGVTLPFN
jgi:hypothetical protein